MSRLKRDLGLLFLALLLAGVAVVLVTPRALAIDEVIDNYENTDRVNVTVDVVHNSTLDAIVLNASIGFGVYENYTTYTEVDPNNRITILNETYIQIVQMTENEDAYVYKDYGVNYFNGNYIHFVDIKPIQHMADNAFVGTWGVSNVTDDFSNVADFYLLYLTWAQGVGTWRLGIWQRIGGVFTTDFSNVNVNTWYYCTINKTATSLVCEIYTDKARTILHDTVSLVVTDMRFRYIFSVWSTTWDNGDWLTLDVMNLDIGVGMVYAPTGYFTTTNFLAGISYNATVALFNSSIPGGTINVEWSPDGAAWTDLGLLTSGFWPEDLRARKSQDAILRFNFTRGGPNVTPRLYQTRLIHEGPGPVSDVTYLSYAIAIILLLFGLMIGSRVRR